MHVCERQLRAELIALQPPATLFLQMTAMVCTESALICCVTTVCELRSPPYGSNKSSSRTQLHFFDWPRLHVCRPSEAQRSAVAM